MLGQTAVLVGSLFFRLTTKGHHSRPQPSSPGQGSRRGYRNKGRPGAAPFALSVRLSREAKIFFSPVARFRATFPYTPGGSVGTFGAEASGVFLVVFTAPSAEGPGAPEIVDGGDRLQFRPMTAAGQAPKTRLPPWETAAGPCFGPGAALPRGDGAQKIFRGDFFEQNQQLSTVPMGRGGPDFADGLQ